MAQRIRDGETVLELCAGEGGFGARIAARARYVGIERGDDMVRAAHRRGLDVRQGDIRAVEWPQADVVVMIDALYHFPDDAPVLLTRMRAAARRAVFIAEPVRNVASLPGLGRLAASCTDPGTGPHRHRFDEAQLRALAGDALLEWVDLGPDRLMVLSSKSRAIPSVPADRLVGSARPAR